VVAASDAGGLDVAGAGEVGEWTSATSTTSRQPEGRTRQRGDATPCRAGINRLGQCSGMPSLLARQWNLSDVRT
jgi:hypothetical protein